MVADIGSGAFEGESAEEFIGQKTEVGGFSGVEGIAQKGLCLLRPCRGMIASRWCEREAATTCQPERAQGVEA